MVWRIGNMRILLAVITVFTANQILAQNEAYDALRLASNDQERIIASQDLAQHMRSELVECTDKECIMQIVEEWPFGIAEAQSNKDWAVVLTWNTESVARVQSYGGFVIFNDNKSDVGLSWVELEHSAKEDVNDEGRSYRASSWTGALYYYMVLKYDGKTPIYTLLGWDGADGIVTRKVIETMSINNGRLRIGVPYLENEQGLKKRHVLEYGDIIQVTLKYDDEGERIILDRLAPNDPTLKGQTAFYGPTLEYDAYHWENNKWTLTSFVEVKNEVRRRDKRLYNDPRPKNNRAR